MSVVGAARSTVDWTVDSWPDTMAMMAARANAERIVRNLEVDLLNYKPDMVFDFTYFVVIEKVKNILNI